MGMPLYGQSFQLAESSTNGLNARAQGPGQAGEFTRAAGFLAYYEVCCKLCGCLETMQPLCWFSLIFAIRNIGVAAHNIVRLSDLKC